MTDTPKPKEAYYLWCFTCKKEVYELYTRENYIHCSKCKDRLTEAKHAKFNKREIK